MAQTMLSTNAMVSYWLSYWLPARSLRVAAVIISGAVALFYNSSAHAVDMGGAPALCRSLFIKVPTIEKLHRNYVYKIDTGSETQAFKIYSGNDKHLILEEAEALWFFKDLVGQARPNSLIQAPAVVRIGEPNEFGLFDLYRQDYKLPKSALSSMSMLVTTFSSARQVSELMADPNVSINIKRNTIKSFHDELNQLILWLEMHPDYRYKGAKVEITIEDGLYGDVLTYTSFDGSFEIPLRDVILRLHSNDQFPGTDLWLNGISNLTVDEQGHFILYDPA